LAVGLLLLFRKKNDYIAGKKLAYILELKRLAVI
jgi:hypothetical protein